MDRRYLGFIIAFVVMVVVFTAMLKKYGPTAGKTNKRTERKYQY
jgi:hypothetical protein